MIAQLVDRRNVEMKLKSLGPWFQLGSVELILYIYFGFLDLLSFCGPLK